MNEQTSSNLNESKSTTKDKQMTNERNKTVISKPNRDL